MMISFAYNRYPLEGSLRVLSGQRIAGHVLKKKQWRIRPTPSACIDGERGRGVGATAVALVMLAGSGWGVGMQNVN